VAGDLLKEVLDRARPVAVYGEQVLVFSQAPTPALPSGHATKSLALALPILLVAMKRSLLLDFLRALILTLGLGVAASRIVLGAHYVSDVLAGIGTALVGLPVALLLADRILKRIKPETLHRKRIVWGAILIGLAGVLVLM
jgi:undecaprenyl-diphosphatase